MVRVDLHLHSTYSDGKLTPEELVSFCYSKGLRTIALSDHDSTEGIQEGRRAACAQDIDLIPALELSASHKGLEIHLLGYFIDIEMKYLQDILADFRGERDSRGEKIIKNLSNDGVDLSWAKVRDLATGGSVGRPHIAQALIEDGYVSSHREAFDKYIGKSCPAFVERMLMDSKEALKLLRDCGGVSVLAHPLYWGLKSDREDIPGLNNVVGQLIEHGLDGIEVYYGGYDENQIKRLESIAKEFSLIPCGGTDYHAFGQVGEALPGDMGPPEAIIGMLKARKHDMSIV